MIFLILCPAALCSPMHPTPLQRHSFIAHTFPAIFRVPIGMHYYIHSHKYLLLDGKLFRIKLTQTRQSAENVHGPHVFMCTGAHYLAALPT